MPPANTVSGDLKVTGEITLGGSTPQAAITAGSGVMSAGNKANGSLHLRSDSNPEFKIDGSVEKIGYAQHSRECRMSDLSAGSAVTYQTHAPRDMTVTGISRRYTAVPASSGGTVVASVTGAGNELLNSATENEEGLTNDTLAAHSLTGTAANLVLSKGDKIIVTVTSDNGDMSGGTDPMYEIYAEDS